MTISQILIPNVRIYIWEIRWQMYPPLEWQFHKFWFLLWQLILVRPGVQMYPPNDDFWLVLIDSYCENSYLADQVADLPPKWWFLIGTDRILLWELISGRSSGRSTTPSMLISQILIPNVRTHIWQIRWQMYLPPLELQFHRFWFLMWEFISGRLGGRCTSPH